MWTTLGLEVRTSRFAPDSIIALLLDKDGYTWSPPPMSTEPSVTAGVLKEPQMIQGSTLETTEEESGVNRGARDPHPYCSKAAPLSPVIWSTE